MTQPSTTAQCTCPAASPRGGARWWILLLCGVIACLLTPAQAMFRSPLAGGGLPFSWISYAMTTPDGGLVAIDSARRRVVRTLADGTVSCVLDGGAAVDGFFYAEEAAVAADGTIFLLNWVPDARGYLVEREEIVRYGGGGGFAGVVHAVAAGSAAHGRYQMAQRPSLRSLAVHGDALSWLELRHDGVAAMEMEIATGEIRRRKFYPLADANVVVAEAVPGMDGRVLATHKNGTILAVDTSGGQVILYSADASPRKTPDGVPGIPWGIAATKDGGIVYTDPVFREVRRLREGYAGSEAAYSMDDLAGEHPESVENLSTYGVAIEEIYFIRVGIDAENRMVLSTIDTVVIKEEDGSARIVKNPVLNWRLRFRAALFWIGLATSLMACVALVRIGCLRFLREKSFSGARLTTGLVVVVLLTLLATLPPLVSKLMDDTLEQKERHLSLLLQTMPRIVDYGKMDALRRAGDFLGEDFRELREGQLRLLRDPAAPWNHGSYCCVYRLFDGRLYVTLYLNDEVGVYFPVYFDDMDKYRAIFADGRQYVVTSSDMHGDWLYGAAPLRDGQGRIFALLEVGTDLYSTRKGTTSLVRDAVFDALSLLAVMLLLMLELIFLADALDNSRSAGGRGEYTRDAMLRLPRPIACAFFTVSSIPIAISPLYMGLLYRADSFLDRDLMLALPLSCKMFCFGLTILLAGRLVRRAGPGVAIHLGFLFSVIGYALAFFFPSMEGFVLASVCLGLGAGAGFIGIRSLLLLVPDTAGRERAYPHFYSGMTAGYYVGMGMGAALVSYLGYATTFLTAALGTLAAWLLVGCVIQPFAPADTGHAHVPLRNETSSRADIWAFLTSARVCLFFLLHFLPVYVLSTYVFYYFPIFAENEGVTIKSIGILLLVYGYIVIYVGPLSSAALLGRVGAGTVIILGQLGWSAGVIAAGLSGSLTVAIAALLFCAFVEGVCAPGENAYLLRLDETRLFGEDRAVAVYETVGKAGETLGPMLFGLAMAYNGGGVLYLGMLGAACALLFALLTGKWLRDR